MDYPVDGCSTSASLPAPAEVDAAQVEQWEQQKARYALMENLQILERAAQIRANPVLMADLRHFCREERDRLALLLDDIG